MGNACLPPLTRLFFQRARRVYADLERQRARLAREEREHRARTAHIVSGHERRSAR
jgi:hypothetical protein